MTETTYLWDASHYDGNLTKAILTKAKSEGIEGFTHKLGEGMANVDETAATALAAARDAGIPVIGGYWFIHGNGDPVAEAKRCIAVADQHEPWWRTFPGWFWQTDAETSTTGLPSPAYVKTFSDTLAQLSGRRVIVYASKGMYGNRLAGVGHPLWNANYPSSRHADFKALYPGASFSGWNKYSGQTPVICQYTSSATIAGLTTCDANAFRGSVQELLALVGADMTLQLRKEDIAAIWAYKLPNGETAKGAVSDTAIRADMSTNHQLPTLEAGQAAAAKQQNAILAALTTIIAHGASVDTAAITAAINAVGATESAAVTALSKQVADLQAQLAAVPPAAAATSA